VSCKAHPTQRSHCMFHSRSTHALPTTGTRHT